MLFCVSHLKKSLLKKILLKNIPIINDFTNKKMFLWETCWRVTTEFKRVRGIFTEESKEGVLMGRTRGLCQAKGRCGEVPEEKRVSYSHGVKCIVTGWLATGLHTARGNTAWDESEVSGGHVRIYLEDSGRRLSGFIQGSDLIRFLFLKHHSGYSVESGLEGGKYRSKKTS